MTSLLDHYEYHMRTVEQFIDEFWWGDEVLKNLEGFRSPTANIENVPIATIFGMDVEINDSLPDDTGYIIDKSLMFRGVSDYEKPIFMPIII